MMRTPSADWTKEPWFGRPVRIVLVPLDGSNAAEVALGPALAIAERAGARLHLAAAATADEAKLYLGKGVEMIQPGSRAFAEVLEEYVGERTEELSLRCRCPVVASAITAEDPRDGLTEYERRVGVDLTVIGTRVPEDEDGTARHLSSDVMRRAPSPLLFVPAAGGDESVGPAASLGPVPPSAVAAILADERGAAADELMCFAASYARLCEAPMLLLDVGPSTEPRGRSAEAEGEAWEDYSARLEHTAAALRESGVAVDTRSVLGADSRATLASIVREERVGTVVLGHASKLLAEWFLFGRAEPGAARRDEPPAGISVVVCPSRA